jgi:hypothetical protein
MSRPVRLRLIRWLTLGLVLLAFANSYRHGVSWALSHSPQDQREVWGWLIAACPEVLVILAVLSFPESRWGLRTLIPGSLAVAWTLWANGSAASRGLSGLFVALSPAIVSLIGLALAHGSDGPVPAPVAQAHGSPAQPEPRLRARRLKVQQAPAPAHEPGSGLTLISSEPVHPAQDHGLGEPVTGLYDRGLIWAQAQPRVPTPAQIIDEIGCSLATAKRVRAAARAARAPLEQNHG